MRWHFPHRICFLAALLTTASSPELCLNGAKGETTLSEKISDLRRCLRDYPQDPLSRTARGQLITLLVASNHYEEALQEYRRQSDLRKPSGEPDLQFFELLLKTGSYAEVLRQTAKAPSNGQDFIRDERLFEFRVQAFLAQGHYRDARQSLDQWLGMHERDGLAVSRFSEDVQNLQQTRRSLLALENVQGAQGKALFTASVPDSLTHWSRRQAVPIVFVQLVPADAANQSPTAKVLNSDQSEATFRKLVTDMNRGFNYLSGGTFSLKFAGLESLYGKTDDLSLSGSHSSLLASRVYAHTIPPLYRMAGKGYVVLVDYRSRSDEEAAYMGDGLIHLAANKLNTMTLIHEVLHGLGATHQEWQELTSRGYAFDPDDRGLMTFDKGELRDLGLEEKNRVLLDWPRVAVLHLPNEKTDLSTVNLLPAYLPAGRQALTLNFH
jgi:hypothetical protein